MGGHRESRFQPSTTTVIHEYDMGSGFHFPHTEDRLSILINGYILSYVIGFGKVRLVTRDVSFFILFYNVSSDLADSIRPEWDPKGLKRWIPSGISSTKSFPFVILFLMGSFHHSYFYL